MQFNIDIVANYILCPVLKYPLFLLLPFWKVLPYYIILLSSFYTILSVSFSSINNLYERRAFYGYDWIEYDQLERPVGIITGGSNGLGKELIRKLLTKSNKIKIVNIDIIQDKDRDLPGSRVIFEQCNLANREEVTNVLQKLKTLYGNDICLIINNAGMRTPYSDFNQTDIGDVLKVMQINCFTPCELMKQLTSTSQCYVVNIASTLGILSPAKISTYAASKAALISFHNSYTFELNVRSNQRTRTLLVITGQLNTQMFTGFEAPRQFFAPVVDSSELAKQIIDQSLVGRQGSIYVPFYSKFAYLLMSMPSIIQASARWFARIDTCLPSEKANDQSIDLIAHRSNDQE